MIRKSTRTFSTLALLGAGSALAAVTFACSHNEPPKMPESETTVTTTPPSADDAGATSTDAGASATGTTTTTAGVVSSTGSKSDVGENKGPKRNVKILATGGTIAGAGSAGGYGYTSGEFKVDDLIKAVPNIDKLANLSGEQVANIGSQDMNDQVWLKLANRANELLSRSDVDGIVITHGTDTMEETAYFLTLVLRGDKPVALVGSMRPATAISADGPANLYNAVAAVSSPGAKGRGVLVVLNDKIHDARNVTKTNTTNVETFESTNRGPVGLVNSGSVDWFEKMNKKNRSLSEFSVSGQNALPKVEIIYAHSNMDASLIDSAIQNGAKGIIIAGVGDGNMSKAALDALQKAVKSGIVVVRSTRLPSGLVLRNNEVDDDKMGFVASGELNPSKSRVLLQLALMRTKEPKEVQRMFNEY